MATANINIRTDQETKAAAQQIFATLGLDMTTAINLFLRQTVRMNDIPFVLTTQRTLPEKRRLQLSKNIRSISNNTGVESLPYGRGCMKGKMWMADDFDEPLDDLKEYTE